MSSWCDIDWLLLSPVPRNAHQVYSFYVKVFPHIYCSDQMRSKNWPFLKIISTDSAETSSLGSWIVQKFCSPAQLECRKMPYLWIYPQKGANFEFSPIKTSLLHTPLQHEITNVFTQIWSIDENLICSIVQISHSPRSQIHFLAWPIWKVNQFIFLLHICFLKFSRRVHQGSNRAHTVDLPVAVIFVEGLKKVMYSSIPKGGWGWVQ